MRQNIFRPRLRLSFGAKIFETETETLKMKGKVSIPRSLETRWHTLPLNFVEEFSSSPEYLIWVELNFTSSFGSSNINLLMIFFPNVIIAAGDYAILSCVCYLAYLTSGSSVELGIHEITSANFGLHNLISQQ